MSALRFPSAIIVLWLCLGMQVPIPHQLTYDDTYRLKWTDFIGDPPSYTSLSAESHTGMSMDMTSEQNKMIFTVICYFKKDQSWVLEKSKTNLKLLKHEQGHWDLREIHTRLFRKKLAGLKMKLNDIAKALPELYNKAVEEAKEEQKKYDKETKHSIDELAQNKWNASLAARLKSTAAWKNPKVTVTPLP